MSFMFPPERLTYDHAPEIGPTKTTVQGGTTLATISGSHLVDPGTTAVLIFYVMANGTAASGAADRENCYIIAPSGTCRFDRSRRFFNPTRFNRDNGSNRASVSVLMYIPTAADIGSSITIEMRPTVAMSGGHGFYALNLKGAFAYEDLQIAHAAASAAQTTSFTKTNKNTLAISCAVFAGAGTYSINWNGGETELADFPLNAAAVANRMAVAYTTSNVIGAGSHQAAPSAAVSTPRAALVTLVFRGRLDKTIAQKPTLTYRGTNINTTGQTIYGPADTLSGFGSDNKNRIWISAYTFPDTADCRLDYNMTGDGVNTNDFAFIAANSADSAGDQATSNGNAVVSYRYFPTGTFINDWEVGFNQASQGLVWTWWELTNYDQMWPLEEYEVNQTAGTRIEYFSTQYKLPPDAVHIAAYHAGNANSVLAQGYTTIRRDIAEDSTRNYHGELDTANDDRDYAAGFHWYLDLAASVYRRAAAATWR